MRRALSLSMIVALLQLFIAPFALAQETAAQATSPAETDMTGKLSLTLTPPLFQIGIAAGSKWSSTLRLANSNPYPLTVYARVVKFTPEGESGNASFALFDRSQEKDPLDLSGWITLPDGAIIIAHDTTADIPFTIDVPATASPGGHYAAILVGTQPGDFKKGESGVSVGSLLASLFFVRIPGNVKEEGDIRDFYAENDLVEHPSTTFVVRFENRGNVHIVPRGNIIIYNMWGKERGRIAINDEANFGNVLPGTTRKFVFSWTGEDSVFEFGRYTARATLTYGEEEKKTAYREIAFWVIPWKPVSAALLAIVVAIWFITFAIRLYVRRIVDFERAAMGVPPPRSGHLRRDVPVSMRSIASPIREDVRTMREQHRSIPAPERSHPYVAFTKKNAIFLAALLVFFVTICSIVWYFIEVFRSERSYEVHVVREEVSVPVAPSLAK